MCDTFETLRLMKSVPSWLRLLTAYLIVPNVMLWILFRIIHGERSVLNLDYLLLALFVPVLKTPLRYVGIQLLLVLDLFHALASTYYFGLPAALRASPDVIHLARSGILLICLGIVVVGVVMDRVTAMIADHPRFDLRDAAILVMVAGSLTTADLLNGSAILFGPRQSTVLPLNISGSGTVAFVSALYLVSRDHDLTKTPADSATRRMIEKDVGEGTLLASQESLAVVVVESWGKFTDVATQERMLGLFHSPAVTERYSVITGTVRFKGHTTDGEFRELCGWSSGSVSLLETSASECLPLQLARSGFTTAAFHGFTERMFGRNRWYPLIGFERSAFKEQLSDGHGQTCGSLFEGMCDDEVANKVETFLVSPPAKRKFVYWLTLNSHLPIRPQDVGLHTFPCENGLAEQKDVCSVTQIVYRVLGRVARIAANPALSKTRFVIVGDHSPSFPLRSSRALFDQREVPYVALLPLPGKEQARAGTSTIVRVVQ
jgi:hypothetical protein